MEDIFLTQDANAALLQQVINNYKKAGSDRKTAEYITRIEQELDTLWQRFVATDRTIRSDAAIPGDHAYYQRDLFNIIGAKFSDIKAKMKLDKTAVTSASEEGHAQTAKQSTVETKRSVVETATSHKASVKTNVTKKNVPTAPSMLIMKQQKVIDTVQRMLDQLMNDDNPRSKQFYAIQLKTIEQHWHHAQQMHEQIWNSAEEANSYDFDQYVITEEKINEGLTFLQERIGSSSTYNQHHQDRTTSTTTGIRLPKIEIPTFNGEYLKWRQFKDLFIELIHSQPLAPCQKMWYLKGSVSGEAAQLIQHFTTTDDNYESAWQVMNNRYENHRLLVNAFLQKLLAQPHCFKENASSIKALHDTTLECLLGLQGLGIDTTNWDPILLHIFTQHLDRTTHMLWEQSLQNPREISTMKNFLTFLELRFQSLEALGSKNSFGSSESTKKTGKPRTPERSYHYKDALHSMQTRPSAVPMHKIFGYGNQPTLTISAGSKAVCKLLQE